MAINLSSKIHTDFASNITWSRDNGDYALTARDVHVWSVKVPDHFNDLFKHYRSVLSHEEFEKAKAFHWEENYRSYLAGRIVLRILFSKYLGKPLSAIRFDTGRGKPAISSSSQLKYNLSYAGKHILISIGLDETGVDIESIRQNFDFKDILASCFSKQEADFIGNDERGSREKFFMHWTRKEALLKFTGQGIIDDLTIIPTLDGSHIVSHEMLHLRTDINLLSFNLNYSCVGSLAYPKAVSNIVYYEWQ